MVIDKVVPSESNIRKQYKKLKKYQGLKQELEKMWKVRTKLIAVVLGALRIVIPKMAEWLKQILGTSELPFQKSTVLGTAKILCEILKVPGL